MLLELSGKERMALQGVVEDDALCECFAEVILEQIESDDLKLESKGRKIAAHLLANSAPDLLMDLCGWGVETLVEKAKKKMNKEEEDSDGE